MFQDPRPVLLLIQPRLVRYLIIINTFVEHHSAVASVSLVEQVAICSSEQVSF